MDSNSRFSFDFNCLVSARRLEEVEVTSLIGTSMPSEPGIGAETPANKVGFVTELSHRRSVLFEACETVEDRTELAMELPLLDPRLLLPEV